MNKKEKFYEKDYDSLKDIADYQNNMYNPGHYIGTGKVPPTVSAPGNATPLAIYCFFMSAVFLSIGLFLFFSDVNVHSSGLIESPLINKIITLIIFIAISLFASLLGLAYLRKAKRYYKSKRVMDKEKSDETSTDKIWQRTCPKCGESHDFDYPKCPKCKYNYIEKN